MVLRNCSSASSVGGVYAIVTRVNRSVGRGLLHRQVPLISSTSLTGSSPTQWKRIVHDYRAKLSRVSTYCRASMPMPSASRPGPHLPPALDSPLSRLNRPVNFDPPDGLESLAGRIRKTSPYTLLPGSASAGLSGKRIQATHQPRLVLQQCSTSAESRRVEWYMLSIWE